MTISVVLCTYNGEKYIEEQLHSILRQTRPVDEIIMLDDGSTDHTIDIAKKILLSGEIPYRIIVNEKNLGAAKNFEKGTHLAKGDWIFTCDQDDVWFEEKTADFVKIFEEKTDCVMVFSDAHITDAKLNTIQESMWAASGFDREKQGWIEQGRYYKVLFSDNMVTGAAMAVKKEFVMSCPPTPEGTLHDYWFALCAPVYGSIAMLKKAELCYRQHEKNVMGAPVKGIVGKIKRWIHTVQILPADREKRAKRAKELKLFYDSFSGNSSAKVYQEQVDKWYEFSVRRELLKDRGKLSGMTQILEDARRGMYQKYVDKKGIVVQDILSLFLKCKEVSR